jgi:hypothetical protein
MAAAMNQPVGCNHRNHQRHECFDQQEQACVMPIPSRERTSERNTVSASSAFRMKPEWSDLPVDSHELIAMCAPLPLFLSVGNSVDPAVDIGHSDAWVDAKGAFLAGFGAGPVYRLLGKNDLGTTVFPPIETGILNGDLIFRQHSAGHTPNPISGPLPNTSLKLLPTRSDFEERG